MAVDVKMAYFKYIVIWIKIWLTSVQFTKENNRLK